VTTRALLLVAAVCVAAPAVAPAQAPPEYNAMCGDIACRVERVPADWQLVSVSRDARTLYLAYESGGCRREDGHATVTETGSRIQIAVDEGEVVAMDTPDGQFGCPRNLSFVRLKVHLEHQVAGRRIVGGPRIHSGWYGRTPPGFPSAPPRVIGLSARDATTALRSQGFHVRRFGARTGAVAFQSPAPGRPDPDTLVHITIGRHAFDAHALTGCMRDAGIRTRAGRPNPGDEDAPDLELVLREPGPPAFVALYADPARARENAPRIRRIARRFHGSVERRGRITIVWVRRPGAERRAAVLGCIAGARP
jgi:PASTA domain